MNASVFLVFGYFALSMFVALYNVLRIKDYENMIANIPENDTECYIPSPSIVTWANIIFLPSIVLELLLLFIDKMIKH